MKDTSTAVWCVNRSHFLGHSKMRWGGQFASTPFPENTQDDPVAILWGWVNPRAVLIGRVVPLLGV